MKIWKVRLWRLVIASAFSAVYLLKNPLTIKGEEVQISDAPSVYAQAAVLMDGENGRVLYGKNEEPATIAESVFAINDECIRR